VNARIPPESTRGTRCFFIQHVSAATALPPSEALAAAHVTGIGGVIAASAEPSAARAMWREVFGLAEAADGAGWRFDLGNANLMLEAGQDTAPDGPPDRWAALILTVADIGAAEKRLRESGIGPVVGDGPDIEVVACGARILLTEGS
jgi:hypothetical protein